MKNLVLLLAFTCTLFVESSAQTFSNIHSNIIKQYYIALNYSLPFEILVNNILVVKDLRNGLQGAENISLYFKKNQKKQKIKIIFYPDVENNLINISSNSLQNQKTVIYSTQNNEHIKIADLKTTPTNEPIPYYEQEWEIEGIPINGINDLSESQILTALNQEELLIEIIEEFEILRKYLNEGKGKMFLNELDSAMNSLFLSENMSIEQQTKYKSNLEEYFDSHKGTLPSLQDYSIKFMGDGRAVALEHANPKYKGLGILSSKDSTNSMFNLNYIIIHKPKNSTSFKIFRYHSSFMPLE